MSTAKEREQARRRQKNKRLRDAAQASTVPPEPELVLPPGSYIERYHDQITVTANGLELIRRAAERGHRQIRIASLLGIGRNEFKKLLGRETTSPITPTRAAWEWGDSKYKDDMQQVIIKEALGGNTNALLHISRTDLENREQGPSVNINNVVSANLVTHTMDPNNPTQMPKWEEGVANLVNPFPPGEAYYRSLLVKGDINQDYFDSVKANNWRPLPPEIKNVKSLPAPTPEQAPEVKPEPASAANPKSAPQRDPRADFKYSTTQQPNPYSKFIF